jgi:hypothetical protein
MTSKFEEENLSRIKPISIRDRASKVAIDEFVDPETQFNASSGQAYGNLIEAFPRVLKGDSLRKVVAALQKAREDKKQILWLVGAHVLKCGLSLYLTSLMRQGFITAMAATGSLTVHELELAFFGKTSEDVGSELSLGRFGMCEETAVHFADACRHADESDLGLGEGIGSYIASSEAPHAKYSLFMNAQRHPLPATVHVALGTDITHQHPNFPAEIVGRLSMRDFRILTAVVGKVFDGGVVVVLGSAVVLPEVFLKAASVCYNLGKTPLGVMAASFDMLSQYRVRENVLSRPFGKGNDSYSFTGHHEIMLPLLYHLLNNS